jgi:NAD(P)-dependent dehydrogenase (short-subunit alcohol dehydrogenase family)
MTDKRVALVTGGSRGIGAAIVRQLAQDGLHVVAMARSLDKLQQVCDEVKAAGGSAEAVTCDIADAKALAEAMDKIIETHGRLDVLVNNAGGGIASAAEDVREEDFDRTVALNLKGTFFAAQAAARVMIGQRFGRIVNIGSQAGFVALPESSVYCMSKAGVAHLTKCLAVEWGRHNITVNAVAPTFIRTPGTEGQLADEAFRNHVLSMIKLGRIGEPVDVAGVVVFLASPAASLITGATILVDGGWTAH